MSKVEVSVQVEVKLRSSESGRGNPVAANSKVLRFRQSGVGGGNDVVSKVQVAGILKQVSTQPSISKPQGV
jgi:hypothetical protein